MHDNAWRVSLNPSRWISSVNLGRKIFIKVFTSALRLAWSPWSKIAGITGRGFPCIRHPHSLTTGQVSLYARCTSFLISLHVSVLDYVISRNWKREVFVWLIAIRHQNISRKDAYDTTTNPRTIAIPILVTSRRQRGYISTWKTA